MKMLRYKRTKLITYKTLFRSKYYAILENGEEKIYVSTFEEAESIINQLKEKNSTNKDNISIAEKYETQVKDFVSTEEAISKLYVDRKSTRLNSVTFRYRMTSA